MTPVREDSPAGYEALVQALDLKIMPRARSSFVRGQGSIRVESDPASGQTATYYPPSYSPGAGLAAQIEFALKYDGVDLEVLRAAFERMDARELEVWIRSKPTGKYSRRTWFFFEWLTGRTLDIPDAAPLAYVDALGDTDYFAASPLPSPRHRVRDDLPGGRDFCPLVRRTEALRSFTDKDLGARVREFTARHDPQLLHRVSQFLYLEETRSSFEIERERPDRKRTTRFVDLLRATNTISSLSTATLVALQKDILDPRYATDGYRTDQNYVGETLANYREHVHFVPPRPQDVTRLMNGWLQCDARLRESSIDPVVQAAALGFGFVFVHPFDDGNGRLHRYLIHHVLSRTGFTPADLVLPVSAVMLADRRGYDACLESFSKPLMERIDWDMDAHGALTVETDSAGFYRYFDATRTAEYLYGVVEKTIETDFAQELEFLQRFDVAWRALREIVDMPDRRMELFVQVCLGNQGKLSARKQKLFPELTDDEVAAMEQALSDAGL